MPAVQGSSAPAGSASPHWPADRFQAFIKLFDGTVSSISLRAVRHDLFLIFSGNVFERVDDVHMSTKRLEWGA